MSSAKRSQGQGDGTDLERMAVLGEMCADAAHEINNLMGAACSYAELEIASREGEGEASYLDTILHLTRLAGDLALNVLHFSSPADGDVADVEEAVGAVFGLFGYRRRK